MNTNSVITGSTHLSVADSIRVSSDEDPLQRTIHNNEQTLAAFVDQYGPEVPSLFQQHTTPSTPPPQANLVAAVSNSPPTPDEVNPFVRRNELSHLTDLLNSFERMNKHRYDQLNSQLHHLNNKLNQQNNKLNQQNNKLKQQSDQLGEILTLLRGFRSCECNLPSVGSKVEK
jgi:flagellar capping protein FliD